MIEETTRAAAGRDEGHVAAGRVTRLGAAANLLLTALKAVVGILGASPVMIADAVHSLSDLASDVVALFALRVSARPPDEDHPYGHGRFETLGTVVLSFFLLAAAIGIGIDAAGRFGTEHVPGSIALWGAVVGIAVKEVLFQVTVRVGRRHGSSLVVANAWHHRSDALSSVAALVGIAGARLGYPFLDPLAALVVAAMIAWLAFSLLVASVREVTDESLQTDMLERLGQDIGALPGVVALHELRARRMGSRVLVDLHVQVDGATTVSDGHQVAERVRRFVFDADPRTSEVLVHVDPEPDEDVPPGERLMPPRAHYDRQIDEVAATVEGIREVVHVQTHFLDGSVSVRVAAKVDPELRISAAAELADRLRLALVEGTDVDAAEVVIAPCVR
jgi:cation diffusion facilitator family transporter